MKVKELMNFVESLHQRGLLTESPERLAFVADL